jgi:hypothetical protein
MTHPDIKNSSYHYAPTSGQKRALAKAHNDKRTGKTPKSIGFITLNPENIALLEKLDLAQIATIPKGAIKMHTDSPRPQHNQEPIAILLAVSKNSQTSEDIHTLTTAHILTDWVQRSCPKATVHYTELIRELSGGSSKTTYTTENWQTMVEDTWNWIESPQAYAGLPTQAHADKIIRLKGSAKSTKKLIMGAAATLFRQFAQDWEAKKLLAPQPIPWGKQDNHAPKPRKTSPPKVPEDPDPEDAESEEEEEEVLQKETEEVDKVIRESEQLLQDALQILLRSTRPTDPHGKPNGSQYVHTESQDKEDPKPATPRTAPTANTSSAIIQAPPSPAPRSSTPSLVPTPHPPRLASSSSSSAPPTPPPATPGTPLPQQLLQQAYAQLLKPTRPARSNAPPSTSISPNKSPAVPTGNPRNTLTPWMCNWCYFTTNRPTQMNCEVCKAVRNTYHPAVYFPPFSALDLAPQTSPDNPLNPRRHTLTKHSRSKPPHHTTNPD